MNAHRLATRLSSAVLVLCACTGGSTQPKPPTALTYTTGAATYATGMLITANTPAASGGAPTSYAVSPELPAGLTLSPSTGAINGTPTAVSARASYTVTASNGGGSATAVLSIAVEDAAPPQDLPNMGQRITPLAPPEAQFETLRPSEFGLVDPFVPSDWEVGQAVTSVVSPDGKTLVVLTSGYNKIFAFPATVVSSSEWIFVYDISGGGAPVKQAVLQVPNAYNGLAFDPVQDAFYVSGGMGDPPPASPPPLPAGYDRVYVFARDSGTGLWSEQPSLDLRHRSGLGLDVGNDGPTPINSQVFMQPTSAGIALSRDGQTMVVANYSNDSVTVFTGGFGQWEWRAEQDLRPGKLHAGSRGVPGGEYPFWVAVVGPSATTLHAKAYVSSLRDREVVVLSLDDVVAGSAVTSANGKPRVTARIKVKGQPNRMTLNADQTRLYVVEDQSDRVSVVDTAKDAVVQTIPVIAPGALLRSSLQQYTGANPNSVTLSPDEKQLWVTNGNLNCVAVVALGDTGTADPSQVVGLIPTGWYPTSVSFSPDGQWAYVINAKSPTGPNGEFCYSSAPLPPTHPATCFSANAYNPQRTKAGLQTFRVPDPEQLGVLTAQVATNGRFASEVSAADADVMAAVRQGVKHVIFVIKENRTYDQILGELEVGNGDPALADFGKAVTPNQNALARTFVTLDNFLDTAEVSNDGWPWTTSARAPDVIERNYPISYAQRGLALESEGLNRNVNVALSTAHERVGADPLTPDDPDLLPGQADVAAPDGPNNEVNTGFIWDAALRAGLTVRSYGFFIDGTLYAPQLAPGSAIPLVHDPAASGTRVAISSSAALAPFTDPYFRGFDTNFPDYYRYTEWARDFDSQPLASLSLVRLMHDHTGSFGTAIDMVNTPELQVADNDYAVGLLVQKVAASKYAQDTLIFIVEDDAQDGGDHVDSHRSVAFVAGAYVKQGAVVSTQYDTIDLVRTIEEVLGLPPLNLNDALARPMADVFAKVPSKWSFVASPSLLLYNTRLPLPPLPAGAVVPKPTHDAKYWARVTRGMDFHSEDRFDFAAYNRILWKGLRGDAPYPTRRSGLDLRHDREALLAKHRAAARAR